jgi:hypothetical protein
MQSLEIRRDNRSVDVFSENIKDFTQREYYWGIALRIDLCERGHICEIEEHGVDNDGNLILNRLPNYNVDKIFKFEDGRQINIEIKTIPEYVRNFFTFKVSSLKSCLEQNAHVLVPKKDNYYLILNKGINEILNNYPHKIYDKFSSNDLAVRIFSKDIEKFIKEKNIAKREWKIKAKQFIHKNYNILSREKAK